MGLKMYAKSAAAVLVGAMCIAVGAIGASRSRNPSAPLPSGGGTADGTFIVRDVRLFDGSDVVERTSVLVRGGKIERIGVDLERPAGVDVIEGAGRTLIPGLIDSHTHAFGDALARALAFGVTTELDMFSDHQQVAVWRAEQRSGGGAPARADIFSAGTMVTAPKGHGTQFGMPIPTIGSPAEAVSFVDARLAEGSDFIKVVFDEGDAYGISLPSITEATLRAVIAAAKARDKLVVVHVGSLTGARVAISAGASGLVHIFGNQPPPSDFGTQTRTAGAFIIPTLSVIESASGVPGGAGLTEVAALAPYLTSVERDALKASFPQRPGATIRLQHAVDATRLAHAAGVPILAGSDAPNTGTVHGATMHRELELLVQAGLPPAAALAAATSAPARAFGLTDRGRVATGLRADLVLLGGNPITDITATRLVEAVWKEGVRVERQPVANAASTAETIKSGAISDFDGATVSAAFGAGWQISTDAMMGGTSQATMQLVKPGAAGSAGALGITGTIKSGSPYPWAGAIFFPASTPMAAADVSRFTEIVFQARGDGREYQAMVLASELGNTPAVQTFTAGAEWQEHVLPLKSFGTTGANLRGILFSAGSSPGLFSLAIDQVRLR
jgi:imidazolonepropionase-like amidohydrolase